MIIEIHTHDLKKVKQKQNFFQTGMNDIQTHTHLALSKTKLNNTKIHEFNENKNSRFKFVRMEKKETTDKKSTHASDRHY